MFRTKRGDFYICIHHAYKNHRGYQKYMKGKDITRRRNTKKELKSGTSVRKTAKPCDVSISTV